MLYSVEDFDIIKNVKTKINKTCSVIPAKAGNPVVEKGIWIPACAGMTN